VNERAPSEKPLEEILRKLKETSDPAYLPTVSMNNLYENVYRVKPPVIDGLLYPGTYLFVGAPKVGKSFFMAQLAYYVSTGRSLWGRSVRQGTVLYLALEDDHRRLQNRFFRMFGVEGTDDLHLAIYAKHLGEGLREAQPAIQNADVLFRGSAGGQAVGAEHAAEPEKPVPLGTGPNSFEIKARVGNEGQRQPGAPHRPFGEFTETAAYGLS